MSDLESPIAMWLRNSMLRLIVDLNGTLPFGWLWSYDSEQAVKQAAG